MKFRILLVTAFAFSALFAEEKPVDPSPPRVSGTIEQTAGPFNISVCYETFSLPLAIAAKLQRQQPADPELYKQLVAAVEKESARQESFIVLRGKSGQKALAESISERIYPTEFSPPSLPCNVSSAPADPIPLPALPTAFTTRNVGNTVEIQATVSEDGQMVEVMIVPETVTEMARETWGQGLAVTEMPVFEAQRITTTATCRVGQPNLIGTLNRPPVSPVDKDSANRVWFAFLTVTLAKP